jgi:Tfp pilus assembly protein PilF
MSECVYPAASGRESLTPMVFIAFSVWAYLREAWRWYAVSMVCFVLALLSKEQSAVLPGIFVVGDLLWSSGWRRNVARWTPIALIFAGYFALRHIIFGGRSIHVDVWDHPLGPLQSLLYGLQTAVLPFVELRYEPPISVWFSWPRSLLSAVALAALIWGIVKCGRSAIAAGIFWLTWFVLLQLPTAHIVAEQEAPFSERYAALACLAFASLIAVVASRLENRKAKTVCIGAATIWIAALALISFARGGYYASDMAFDSQWELTNPKSAEAHSGMGVVYEKRGDVDSAIAEYEDALTCNPQDWTANDNLGVILMKRGQYRAAERYLRIVAAAHIHDPQIMINYGLTLEMLSIQEKNVPFRDAARKWFEHAIKIDPDYANAHFELGAWHARFGDPAIARAELLKALSLDPNLEQAKIVLAQLNQRATQPD